MSSSPDIWFAFARTFAVLFAVLALLIFVFYLIKKFPVMKGVRGSGSYIKVLAMHHLSPKEKLVIVDVLGQTALIGVTPGRISKIMSIENQMTPGDLKEEKTGGFSRYLSEKMGKTPDAADQKAR